MKFSIFYEVYGKINFNDKIGYEKENINEKNKNQDIWIYPCALH